MGEAKVLLGVGVGGANGLLGAGVGLAGDGRGAGDLPNVLGLVDGLADDRAPA